MVGCISRLANHLYPRSKKVVDYVPFAPSKSELQKEQTTCSICFNPSPDICHEGGGNLHPDHLACVKPWIIKAKTCPTCRVQINPDSVKSPKELNEKRKKWFKRLFSNTVCTLGSFATSCAVKFCISLITSDTIFISVGAAATTSILSGKILAKVASKLNSDMPANQYPVLLVANLVANLASGVFVNSNPLIDFGSVFVFGMVLANAHYKMSKTS